MTVLEQALEHPHNTAAQVVYDLYPDAGNPWSGRIKAVWRGGGGLNVAVNTKTLYDFVGGETFSVWQLLTEVAGYSTQDAARYLIARAGLRSEPFNRRAARRTASPKTDRSTRAHVDLAAFERLSTTGFSAYLERKGVDGSSCQALRYGRGFIAVQMSQITEAGILKPASEQRIDAKGGKRFAKGGTTKGACALIGAGTLGEALATGRIWIAEGFATALTVHAATGKPVLCVFTAGNLEPVVKAIRTLKSRKQLDILIAADNDQHKPQYGNPGLEKAHRAALLHGCKVVAPEFTDLSSKPTDFNDLQALSGIDEVPTQLERLVLPSPNLAYAAAARRREKRLPASQERNLPPLAQLSDGVTLVRAPQGTGKTEALAPLIDHYQRLGLRVLYLTHRVTLADDAARRLKLEVYSDDLLKKQLHLVPALACTVNSLHHLLDADGKLSTFDVVIVDESEQFVRALTGRHIANKRRNLEALEFLLRRARKLVMLDADLGKLTRTLLQQVRPHERYHLLQHVYPVGTGRTMRIHERRDDLYAALAQFTEPVIIVTNSKRESEAVHAYLTALGKHGRLINSDTSSDDAALLANLDASTRGLDYLVCSPSVSTGVSLTSGHFKHVFGLFHASVGVPEDALQALWRVRTQVTYDVWIDPRGTREHIDLGAKYGVTKEHEALLLKRCVGHESAFYRTLAFEAERQEQRKQAAYRLNFLELAALQGFELTMLEHDPENAGIAREARELADALHINALEGARHLDEDQAAQLRAARPHALEDRLALERFETVNFYRLAQEEPLRPYLELDQRGRYRRCLTRLELTLADDTQTQSAVDQLFEQREMRADIPALASRNEFYRALLKAVGFDVAAAAVLSDGTVQLDMPRYHAEQLESFRLWVEANRAWLCGLVALPAPDKLRANLIRYVGTWLKALGLKQVRTGKNALGVYALQVETLEIACRTMKRRGTLFLKKKILEKTVPTSPASTATWLKQLLETGKLDDFGSRRLAMIREKLEVDDQPWLHQLASSRTVGQLVNP